jgi:hypothetical protein
MLSPSNGSDMIGESPQIPFRLACQSGIKGVVDHLRKAEHPTKVPVLGSGIWSKLRLAESCLRQGEERAMTDI